MTTRLPDAVSDAHEGTVLCCPDCGAELVHAGMSIPVYDCVSCDAMYQLIDGKLEPVPEGCPLAGS